MTPTITIDSRGFDAMVSGVQRSLENFGQFPETKKVLDVVTQRVLEGCIRRTAMAAVAKIRKAFKAKGNHASAPGIAMSINSGTRGGVEGRVWYGEDPAVSTSVTSNQRAALRAKANRGGKVWVVMENAVNPGAGMLRRFQVLDRFRQADIKGRIARQLAAALGARGLARNSWLQIAQRLGITLSNIAGGAQVAKARPSTGATYIAGTGERKTALGRLYYEIRNNYPFSKFRITGASILSQAIKGEIGYFNTNMRKGVFNDLSQIISKYKGFASQ